MNRSDLLRVQAVTGYPAVSILMTTHRTHPDNQQDPIRLKNLVKEATDRLHSEFSAREVQPLLDRLHTLVEEIDPQHNLDGLALFVNATFAERFDLPFPIADRVEIGEAFATRDLVFALNRSPRYWALVLSEQPTRLYEGVLETLTEVRAHGFPMTHEGPGGATNLPGGWGINRSRERDEQHRHFFRRVDQALAALIQADPLPIVVAGVQDYQSYFREVTQHGDLILGTLHGSHDSTPAHELGKLVWPVAQEGFAQRRQAALSELEQAVGAKRFASGINEVWFTAQEGRGNLLLVEEGYQYPARPTADGMALLPVDDPRAPDTLDDAVDTVIETVLSKGGRVVFTNPGVLEAHQRIALTLRY
jgi:hypothetical protein